MEIKRVCDKCFHRDTCMYLNGKFYCSACYLVMVLADRGLSKNHASTAQELWALNHVHVLGKTARQTRRRKFYDQKLPGMD